MRHRLILGDCLEVLKKEKANSVDIILADLPYGTTGNKWDSIIPMYSYIKEDGKFLYEEEYLLRECKKGKTYKEALKTFKDKSEAGLWELYERVLKKGGVILLFSQQPFTSTLTRHKWFRYEWIWEKTSATGYLNARKMPMKAHENILVYYEKLPTYNPQKTKGHKRKVSNSESRNKSIRRREKEKGDDYTYGKETGAPNYDSTERYPRDVIIFPSDKQRASIHTTQKPVALLEYFIKTYSNLDEDTVVLDNVSGSGSTMVACGNLGVKSINIEKNTSNYKDSLERMNTLNIAYAQN